jgi:hypothetical protein
MEIIGKSEVYAAAYEAAQLQGADGGDMLFAAYNTAQELGAINTTNPAPMVAERRQFLAAKTVAPAPAAASTPAPAPASRSNFADNYDSAAPAPLSPADEVAQLRNQAAARAANAKLRARSEAIDAADQEAADRRLGANPDPFASPAAPAVVAAAAAESNEAVKNAYIAAGEAWRKLGANTDTTQDAALAEAARVAQDAAEKVKASAALAAAPAPVEAVAPNMFGGECEVPVQGPSYAATKIRGDGWCFYKAVLAGSGKPGYTEAEENVSIEARKQSDDGAYALAYQLRDLLVGPNLELFKKIYGSPRPTTIVDGSGSRRETLNADQFIARMVQEPIEVKGFLAPRVYAEGDALAPFVANLLHVRIAIYAGGQLSGKGCPDNEPNAPVVSLDYVNGDHYNVFLPLPTQLVPAPPAEEEPAASESRRPSSAASVASGPSSAESESRRPSSATSLGSVGVPQLRDQDFAVRLGAAKVKFEQMRAATGKLEKTVNASEVVKKKPTKRRKQTQRINPADIDNIYRELKASQLTRKAKTDIERNKRAQRRLTASVAPAPVEAELAAIEADLKSAEDIVGQFKAMVDELRAKDSGVPKVAEWIMTADLELELQLDYLSQVEQNLATVPNPVDITRLRGMPRPPSSASVTSTQRLSALTPGQQAYYQGMRSPRGQRFTPRTSQRPRTPRGGRKTPRRKLRNSTFRRHRKH